MDSYNLKNIKEFEKTGHKSNSELSCQVSFTSVHFLSKTNEWTTPQTLFDELNNEFNFTLDPCCTIENAKCKKFYTMAEDGLSQTWANEVVFMNPPYGREIGKWVEKAYNEHKKNNITVVCLIPARTDTTYWHKYIFGKATEIRYIKGRLKFGESKNGAPFPSAIVVYKRAS